LTTRAIVGPGGGLVGSGGGFVGPAIPVAAWGGGASPHGGFLGGTGQSDVNAASNYGA